MIWICVFSGKKRWPFGLFCVWSQIICHLPSSNICAHFISDIYAINVNCLFFILSLFCADLMIRYWGFAIDLWRSHDPPTTKIVTVPKLTENREPIRRHWVVAFLVLTLLALFASYLYLCLIFLHCILLLPFLLISWYWQIPVLSFILISVCRPSKANESKRKLTVLWIEWNVHNDLLILYTASCLLAYKRE